ncbi:hypothetical protein [Streptomyces neyagawaensis]|uniref:Uncharacterized protein n=1 Tax=Streptomyces neyagawaensis TaxID=42238 RepID=A0ABV3B8P3_9ACTN
MGTGAENLHWFAWNPDPATTLPAVGSELDRTRRMLPGRVL